MPIPEDTGIVPKQPQTGRTDVDAPTYDSLELRGMIELFNKRDNYLVNRIIELQDRVQAMLDSVGAVANMRTAGLAVSISATNNRPRNDAIQDYKDLIIAGDADP